MKIIHLWKTKIIITLEISPHHVSIIVGDEQKNEKMQLNHRKKIPFTYITISLI